MGINENQKGPKIETYLQVYEKSNNTSYKGCYNIPQSLGNVIPRGLILTNEEIILCEEDYSSWPQLKNSRLESYKPNNPQFKIVNRFNWMDIESINFSRSNPQYVSLSFREDGTNKSDIWKMYTKSEEEKDRLFVVYSLLFKKHFNITCHALYTDE